MSEIILSVDIKPQTPNPSLLSMTRIKCYKFDYVLVLDEVSVSKFLSKETSTFLAFGTPKPQQRMYTVFNRFHQNEKNQLTARKKWLKAAKLEVHNVIQKK